MKNLSSLTLILCLFVSCRIGDAFSWQTVTLNKKDYTLKLPKGYDVIIISANQRLGYRFVYKDSSTIYINLDDCNPNLSRVKTLGDSLYFERFEKLDFSFLGEEHKVKDTMDLSGLDSLTGLYFRDLKIDEIGYGYFNVKLENKALFDHVIDFKLNASD